MQNETVFLIMARGGSKDPPRKNLLPVAGVPCVARIVRQCREFYPDWPIVVSSDDTEIIRACCSADPSGHSVIAINRPACLAGDNSRVADAIEHAFLVLRSSWGWPVNEACFLEGNTVCTRPELIAQSLDLLRRTQADSTICTMPIGLQQPGLLATRQPDGFLDFGWLHAGSSGNRQDGPADQCYGGPGPHWLRPSNYDLPDSGSPCRYLGRRVAGLPTRPGDVTHIDSMADLRLAEFYLGEAKRREPAKPTAAKNEEAQTWLCVS